jgi:hypothetical protein
MSAFWDLIPKNGLTLYTKIHNMIFFIFFFEKKDHAKRMSRLISAKKSPVHVQPCQIADVKYEYYGSKFGLHPYIYDFYIYLLPTAI